MLTAGAGMENADCWCRKAATQENRMEVREERMLTARVGRLLLGKAKCRRKKGEC